MRGARSDRPTTRRLLLLSLLVPAGSAPTDRRAQQLSAQLGLERRSDRKFAEFVETHQEGDGEGLQRQWGPSSDGSCPSNMTITDSAGAIHYAARVVQGRSVLTPRVCAWMIRPSIFRDDDVFKDLSGPITLTFTRFQLDNSESIEVWDPHDGYVDGVPNIKRLREAEAANAEIARRQMEERRGADMSKYEEVIYADEKRPARLIARFGGGTNAPPPLSSAAAQLLLVYRSQGVSLSSSAAWAEVTAALRVPDLRRAIRAFDLAASARLRGFFGQDARRVIRGLVTRSAVNGTRLTAARAKAEATASEAAGDEGEGEGEGEGDEGGSADGPKPSPPPAAADTAHTRAMRSLLSDYDRLYDNAYATVVGEARHYQGSAEQAAAEYLGPPTSERANESAPLLSLFAVNFTVLADCESILSKSSGSLPPLTVEGSKRNYQALPFPLKPSSCQQLNIVGPQRTRDRPFTIAEDIMKVTVEEQLTQCVVPSGGCAAVSIIQDAYTPYGNCTEMCPPFLECVHAMLQTNRTREARLHCLQTEAGRACSMRTPITFDEEVSVDASGAVVATTYTRRGNAGVCIPYSECLECAALRFAEYFTCVVGCRRSPASPDCLDCSFSYEDSHLKLLLLRERLWEGYMLGAYGDYLLTDYLGANFTSCADERVGCVSTAAFEREAYGTGTTPADYAEEVEPTYSYGEDHRAGLDEEGEEGGGKQKGEGS